MSDIDTNITFPEVTGVAEPSQLITLKPELYVAQVFDPFRDALKKAIKEAGRVKYDITTKDGMAAAKEQRAIFKAIRTNAESMRKARKAPIIEIGKLLDTRHQELEDLITPYESRYDVEIKAEEKRIADEKQRKIDEERVRVEALENKVQLLKNVPMTMLQADAATLAKAIEQHSLLVLDPKEYEEYIEDAINAVNATLVELEKLRKMAVVREEEQRLAELMRQEEARQREAERAELARLKAESEQRQKVLDEEARQRAEANAAQAKRIAELEAQLAAANKTKEPEQETKPINSTGPSYSSTTFRDDGVPIFFCDVNEGEENTNPATSDPTAQQSVPSTVPTLTLGKIGTRLGFNLTADFLRSIGFEPAGRERSATLYHESSWPAICSALILHINRARHPQQQAA